MKHFFFLPLLFVLIVTGCKDKGKTIPTQLLLISNVKYFKAFPDGLERMKIVKKSLKGRFKINTLEIKNFENTERELENFLKTKENEKTRFVVFVEPFLFPLITNSSALSKFDLKVISYGIGGSPSSSLSGLFHVCISQEHLFKKIKFLLEEDFRKTNSWINCFFRQCKRTRFDEIFHPDEYRKVSGAVRAGKSKKIGRERSV